MLPALAQEPWCFHPSQIAELTDWQVMELYIRPAVKRAEELKKDVDRDRAESPFSSPSSPSPKASRLPPREQSIDIMVDLLGITREQAAADWDRANKANGG